MKITAQIFTLFLALFLLFPVIVHAATIQTATSPSPITNETSTVTLTLTSDEPFFNTNLEYTFQAWKSGSDINDCGVSRQYNLPGSARTTDSKQLVLQWELTKLCQKRPGLWNVGIWAGAFANTDLNTLYTSTSFNLRSVNEEPNSGTVEIYAAKPVYQLGDTLQVTIVNPIEGRFYHFWWDGDRRDFAAISSKREGGIFDSVNNLLFPDNGASFNINLGQGDTGEKMTTPNPSLKLCMLDTDGWQPFAAPAIAGAFGGCKYQALFNLVRIKTQPDSLVCNILPREPTAGDVITLQASGLPINKNYQAYLVTSGVAQPVAQRQDSGPNGSVAMTLGSNLTIGSYSSYLQDDSGQKFCDNTTFSTVAEPTPGGTGSGSTSTITSCKPGEQGCSSSAGVDCRTDTGATLRPDETITNDKKGLLTAIGCVPTQPQALIQSLIKFGSAIGGGIALLLMIAGGLQMITSGGDQHKLQDAREQFTNAVIGLLFIIFAVLLLQIIGVDILSIPGFERT